MWLASLRRLVSGKYRSPQIRRSRPQRRWITPNLDHLEERIVPSTLDVNAGDTAGLIAAINQANSDSSSGTNDTIVLNANAQSSSVYNFTAADNTTNGANVLPAITATNLTIVGNGSTLNAGGFGRLLDVALSAGLTLENLTLTGGKVSGSTAQGGAVYNSGNLTVQSAIVGGNQAVGGSGYNGEGGGIYSNGGSVTLLNDVIGRKAVQQYNLSTGTSKHTTAGGSNKAEGGTGGSGQGAGLYVSSGTVKISNCTFAGNKAIGGANGNGQGGGLYANGSSLTLLNDFLGSKSTTFVNSSGQLIASAIGAPNSATGGAGGSGQGAGLYVSGGTVQVSGGTLIDNQATGGGGAAGSGGGNAQGGGIYANATTLTLTGAAVNANGVHAGNGGAGTANSGRFVGGAGGTAQGGGIFANATTLTVSGGSVNGNTADAGYGGNGAAGTVSHVTGGTGGTSGLAQGGGMFVQGGSVTLTKAASVTNNTLSAGQGGVGGVGYNSGAGGVGGAGNNAEGGGVFAANAPIEVEAGATVNSNSLHGGGGGSGGAGKTGGQGGSGGQALGGGLFVQGASVSITGANTTIAYNSLRGGAGGFGGAGTTAGNGGIGGDVYGGGLYAVGNSVALSNGAAIEYNDVYGGAGAAGHGGSNGGSGGSGGVGGSALGGGAYLAGGGNSLQINAGLTNPASVSILYNTVTGGAGGGGGFGGKGVGEVGGSGGNAAAGGLAAGGGLAVDGSGNTTLPAVSLSAATIELNTVTGGSGGNGGTGGTGSFGGWAGGKGGLSGSGAAAFGGGLYVNDAALTLANTSIGQNTLSGGQGGVGGTGGRSLGHITSSTATSYGGTGGQGAAGGNAAVGQGGGLYVNGSTVTLNTATLTSNTVYGGQGGGGGYGGRAGIGYDANVTTTGHHGDPGGKGGSGGSGAAGQGGGLAANSSTLTVRNTAVTGNLVYAGAGGNGGGGGGGASNNHFGGSGGSGGSGGNAGGGQGGGLYLNGGAFTLVNSTAAANTIHGDSGGTGGAGGHGGGGKINGGNGGAGGAGGNAAAIAGGGVFASGNTVQLVNATLANNTLNDGSGGNGGNGGSGSLSNGSGGNAGNGGNAASGQGGGLYANGGSLSLLNATLAYNAITAGTPGAPGTPGQGIIAYTGTGKTIQVSPPGQSGSPGTTAGTDQGGGLYVGSASPATLENTLLALNTAATDPDVAGTFSSSDHDLIGNSQGFSSTTSNGDIVGLYSTTQLASFIGQLANNGGPTQTIAPAWTSPLISTGDPSAATAAAIATAEGVSPATDQRGLPRVLDNTIDIGAVEAQVLLDGTPSASTVTAGGTITYTLTVTNEEATAVNVTLSDVMPTYTTYNSGSASGANWTITEPSSNNTLTATTTLAAASPTAPTTATLSFSVTVAANVPGNTVIADTATVVPTNNTAAGGRSVTMKTTVPQSVTVTANITNPAITSSGQVNATLTASSSSSTDAQYGFTYTIEWGDGSSQTVAATANNGSGVAVSHSYASAGLYTIGVTAADQQGVTSQTATAVVVYSTQASDAITVSGGSAGQAALTTTDEGSLTTTATPDQVLIAGSGGSDTYTVNFGSNLITPITIAGGGSTSGDSLVVNGDNSSTNVIDKTAGQITWGNPVTETVYFSGIPNTTINAYGTSTNYITDPGGSSTINGGPDATNYYTIDMGNLLGPVTINSTSGTSNVTVNGPPGSNVLTLTSTQLTGDGETINFNLGTTATNFTVNDGSGNNELVVQGTPPGPLSNPNVGEIATSASGPVPVNTNISASATFSGSDGDNFDAVWNWGDGSPNSSETISGTGTVTGSHTFTAAGVYTVTLTVTDTSKPNLAAGQSTFQYVVVYDASAGFVTGGGWFSSPAGADTADTTLTGKAHFGFNAKYKSGSSVPTGQTEFNFPAANLDFHSTGYDWLVINSDGYQAQFQGSGTINGTGNYGILVSMADNDATSSGPDAIGIEIWDKNNNNAVVYDTGEVAINTYPTTPLLGGGDIQVHANTVQTALAVLTGGGTTSPTLPPAPPAGPPGPSSTPTPVTVSTPGADSWLTLAANLLDAWERDLSQWEAAMVQTLDQLFADWDQIVLDSLESIPAELVQGRPF